MVLLPVVAVASGCAYGLEHQPATEKEASVIAVGRAASSDATRFRFFSQSSFWNRAVPADAPLDRDSAQITRFFNAQVAAEQQAKAGPTVVTTRWSVPLYTVSAGQPTVRVKLTNGVEALQAAWKSVPLPSHAQPAAGTDQHLVVWQPSTDRLWEFWKLQKTAAGWQASWGGAMRDVSSSSGAYGPGAWPGASTHWGASASSLSLAGGLITLDDLAHGRIKHALALAVPNVRSGVYSLPAQRDDGKSGNPLSLPEGAHLRLDPKLNLAKLHLPPFTLMLAEAAQRYGMFVRSQAGIVDFIGEDPTPTGTNPYVGPSGYFEGKDPNEAIASFPWSHLQLLRMKLRQDGRQLSSASSR